MSSLLTAERIGRFMMYLWLRYIHKEHICYKDVDLWYSGWVFLSIGLCVLGIIVGITLLYFFLTD